MRPLPPSPPPFGFTEVVDGEARSPLLPQSLTATWQNHSVRSRQCVAASGLFVVISTCLLVVYVLTKPPTVQVVAHADEGAVR